MKDVKGADGVNRRHLKYFSTSGLILSIGTGAILASVAMLLWTWFIWWSYLLYILGFVFFPVGVVLFIIGTVGKSTDEEIDKVIAKLSAEADVDPERDAAVIKRQLRKPTPEVVSGYDYSDGRMFKKAKGNVVRSEIFNKATLLALNDGVCVICATVDILRESVERTQLEIPYGEIDDMRVVFERRTVRFMKNSFSVKYSRLEIISHGECVLSVPASESATLDAFIGEIKRHIG